VIVRMAVPTDSEACIHLLTRLPNYFAIDTHDVVRAALTTGSAWVALEHDELVGFAVAEHRHTKTAEITFAAVDPLRQGQGIGTHLVNAVFDHATKHGIVLIEVKTLDASSGYEPFVSTRAFWEARGFHQVDCIDPHPGWKPGNPAAILVAALTATRED
jgi:GNAT superfamily N-acetyltransferase